MGVPGTTPPVVRRFALQQATFLKQARLYARVTDANESTVLRVVPLGALIVTLALSTNREGYALAGAAHVAADRALAAVLAGAAVVLAVLGQGLPAGLCAGGAIAQSLLTLTTSYAERPGRDDETRATTITAG